MNIVLLSNPKSGTGKGAAVAADIASRLQKAGHHVTPLAAGPDLSAAALAESLRSADLLVVAGGDGTLHHALPAIIETGIAFYHYPLGTENLFTREFLMDRDPETLIRAIRAGRMRICDAATCNGRHFALMMSVGFDACIVERVAANRRGGVTRGAYVRHALRELLSPRVPRCTVRVDGRVVVEDQHGLLVVANSRQYAARLDPARDASMSDGELDVVFYPHRGSMGLARWMAATAAGMHVSMKGLVTARGEEIVVGLDREWPHQVDGEAAGMLGGAEVRVVEGALRVLVP